MPFCRSSLWSWNSLFVFLGLRQRRWEAAVMTECWEQSFVPGGVQKRRLSRPRWNRNNSVMIVIIFLHITQSSPQTDGSVRLFISTMLISGHFIHLWLVFVYWSFYVIINTVWQLTAHNAECMLSNPLDTSCHLKSGRVATSTGGIILIILLIVFSIS